MAFEQFKYQREGRSKRGNQRTTDDLNKIAAGQKILMAAIAIYFVVVFSLILLRGSFPPLAGLLIPAAAVAANVALLVAAARIYGGAVALLLFLLSFIPVAGLIILLSINSKATKVLKQNGYEVGLLGAKAK